MKAVPQGPPDGRAPQAAHTRRIEVVLLSSDDGTIIDLGPVLGDRYRTRPVDGLDELATAPFDGEQLLLLDATHRPDALGEAFRIESQAPAVPLIVIDSAANGSRWSTALARGGVIAIVPREDIAGPAMQRALAAAEARLRPPPQPDMSRRSVQPPPAEPARRRPLAVVLLGVAVLAVGAGYYLRERHRAPAVPPVATAPAPARDSETAATAPARSALQLLSAARIAFAGQRQLPQPDAGPGGESALELYVQVLGIDPRSEEARDGIRRLANLARPRIQADIAAGRFEDATSLLALLRSAGVDSESMAALDAELAAARPRRLATQVQEALSAGDITTAEQALAQLATLGADAADLQPMQQALESRRQDVQLAEMASAVSMAIGAGNLLDPLADNARTRIQAMRQINRLHAATLEAQREYAAALLARAREAAGRAQFDAAQRYLAAAGDVASPEELATGQRQLDAAIAAAAERVAPPASAPAPAAFAAAQPAAAPAAAPEVINARATRPLSVAYPSQALAQKLTGHVVIEFLLHSDGRAYEARVVESQPAGVFDKAALAGVANGRFDTGALGADREPRLARLRVSFR